MLVPLAILEPVKPLGFYLTAKGHLVSGGSVIAMGEIVKVTLVEQVIEITKPKLLTFHWFAWMYSHWEAVLDRLRSIRVWQSIKRKMQATFARVRQMKAEWMRDDQLIWVQLASVHCSQDAPTVRRPLLCRVIVPSQTQVRSGHTSCNRRNARHPVLVCASIR